MLEAYHVIFSSYVLVFALSKADAIAFEGRIL